MCNSEGVVKVAQRVKFPIFLLDSDEELLDAFERQFITLDEDANRVGHEFCRHLEDIIRQGSAEKHDLGSGREVTVDVINLILEALIEELVGLVQNEHLDVARAEGAPPNHVEDPAGCSRDDVLAIFEFTNVLTNRSAADARVTLHVHVVAQCEDNGLNLRREFAGGREDERLGLSHGDVDGLQHGYREGGGFTRAGLGLGDDISPLRYREDSTLLDCGGLFKVCTMQVSENEIRAKSEQCAL